MQVAAASPSVGYASLPGSVSPLIQKHLVKAAGAVPGDQQVRFLVGVPSQDPGGLMAAAKTNATRHMQMTSQEVAAEYGASLTDIATVQQYLQGQGFIYLGEEPDGLALSFEGTAAQVDAAFETEIENYTYAGHKGYLPSAGLSVPAALQGKVTGILGLDTLLEPISMLKLEGAANGSSFDALNHTALEMQTAYHVTPLYQNGYDGKGETIAVATWAEYDPSDVAAFSSQMGLPQNQFVNAAPFEVIDPTGTGYASKQGGSDETSVDVEWSHASAPGAMQEVAVGDLGATDFQQSMYDVYSALASGQEGLSTPNDITTSWGYPEWEAPPESNQVLDELFASIAAQGITMFAASGDGDVQDLNVMYPASDPYILGVGGTQVSLNPNGTIAAEKAWGQAPFDQFYTASTGGYSTQFAAPPWAVSTQVAYAPSTLITPSVPYLPGMRGVPDVSLNAFGYLGYWQQGWYGFLGTSLGAPSWAGIYADVDQMVKAETGTSGLGFVAPALYAVASQPNAPFHDITQGTNGQWNAGPGWDPVTGLGTPEVAALGQDLVNYIQQGGATAPGPFISVVTPTAADGSNSWLGISDPLVAMNTPDMNVPLTDAIVAGSLTDISGSGFGTDAGQVYLVSNDGSIDIPLSVERWGPNEIVLDTTGAIDASPGIYNLVVDVPGLAQPLVTGVALESGIALFNLSLDGSGTVSGPLSVDNYYSVSQSVYANGEISALVRTLETYLSDGTIPFEMPAAIFIPGLSTPQAPILNQADPSSFTQTGDNMLVTLTSPSAQLLYVTLNPVNVNPVPLYGTDMWGFPEYLVPAGEPLAAIDPTAGPVGVIVQDASNPGMVAPGEAAIDFLPGDPVTYSVTPLANTMGGTTVETATYDPSQAVPIALQVLDPNSNVVPDQPANWQVTLMGGETPDLSGGTPNVGGVVNSVVEGGAPTVSATVYYSTNSGQTWVEAPPDAVEPATYDVPVEGPVLISIPDSTVGDSFSAFVTAPAPANLLPWLAEGPMPLEISVVPQSQLALQAVGTPGLGVFNEVGMAVYDQQGNLVSGASDQISLAVQGPGVTIYDQNKDPIVSGVDGTYPITLTDGQAIFYYTTDAATTPLSGPLQFIAYDDSVYPLAAELTQMIQPGPVVALSVHVFSSASVGSGQFGDNQQEIVDVRALDAYGNVATGFSDEVGLEIQGGPGIVVREGNDKAQTQLTPDSGVYELQAVQGQALFLVSSQSPGTVDYVARDLGGQGAQSGVSSGTFLSPYAAELDISHGGSVIANGSIWAGVPQQVTVLSQDVFGNLVSSNGDTVALAVYGPSGATVTVTDAGGTTLTPDANGNYELTLRGGKATYYVTSPLAGGISYAAQDLSVPSIESATDQATISSYPVTLTALPLTFSGANGTSVSGSGGSVVLQHGMSYNIQISFDNNDAAMPVTPILEVIGPDGSVAFLQGAQASVKGGLETISYQGFNPSQTGSYTVKVFTWNHWLEQGGVPIGVPYQMNVQVQ